jgi:hypothetical protein
MGHSLNDRIGLRLAEEIAARLRSRPELMEIARENLRSWSRRNSDSPGLLRCYREWSDLLDRPLEAALAAMTADTDDGQRLRQNSPFAGVLSPGEVWEIKRRVRDEQAAV